MTQRERQAPAGVVEAVPPPPATQPTLHPAATLTEVSPLPAWEELYRSASPAQRQEWLTLARRQGVVYAHQLPRPADGGTPEAARHPLTALLAGDVERLQPLHAGPVTPTDTALDAVQREAVAKAVETPDVCLIQGQAGTGKSRVVAEVVTQAALRGRRVLLLAPAPAALDRVLEQVAGREQLCPIRCVGKDEDPNALPPAARAVTLAERLRSFRDHTLARAREEAHAAQKRCADRRREEPLWARLEDLARAHTSLADQARALQERRDLAPRQVEQEAAAAEHGPEGSAASSWSSPLRQAFRSREEVFARVEAALGEIGQRRRACEEERNGLAGQRDALRPLAEAKQLGHWWTGRWWRAKLRGDVAARLADLQARIDQAEQALREFDRQAGCLTAEKDQAAQAYGAERARLVQAEVARRQAEVEEQGTALEQERRLVEEKWRAASQGLAEPATRPAALTAEAVRDAREAWQRQAGQDEERRAFAAQWVNCLEESLAGLPARLPQLANLVAATTTALASDEHFGEASPHGHGFDLLVLEEAHLVTESEFTRVARRARRWVVVGEPAGPDAPPSGEPPPPRARTGAPPRSRPTPARPTRPGFFQKLWQHLHCDPRRLGYAWDREHGRFCCRLRPVPPELRHALECERVADFPDVELRILTGPRTPPQLAEVVFPAAMTIVQAKQFIYRELQELPVQATGPCVRWLEEPDRLVLQLADPGLAHAVAVPLEPGVRELVGEPGGADNPEGAAPAPWQTCCLEFDRGAGWDRGRAADWVRQHTNLRDLGRTARLDRQYRMAPGLALVVSDLVTGDSPVPASPAEKAPSRGRDANHPDGAAVEFVPVPPLPRGRGDHSRGRGDNRAQPATAPAAVPLPRAGAGLELDLTDPRHLDRLPADLRPGLPERGLVNYLEAQAVVRQVKELTAARPGRERPTVGVVCLYQAQAELVRRLLAKAGPGVKVDVPAGFRQHECDVIFLGLTRSHGHRAVSFGEGPQALALALTRARQRLIIFGDVGTLARRCQWEGAVDHLDGDAGARERGLLLRLTGYLQGRGRHAHVFRLREGGGA